MVGPGLSRGQGSGVRVVPPYSVTCVRRLLCAGCVALLLLGVAVRAAAETVVESEIQNQLIGVWDGSDLGLGGVAVGRIEFRSAPAPMVQARLVLNTTAAQLQSNGDTISTAFVDVPRASLRFRFPLTEDYTMRVAAGRDRLAWGIGSLFNAGDLIYGADGSGAADFTALDDLRDETSWLYSAYLPIGERAYLEPVFLPPLPELVLGDELAATGTAVVPGGADESRLGLRLHAVMGGLSLEPAYLYDGNEDMHHAAFSVQGNLWADLYAAARLSLDDRIPSQFGSVLEERSSASLGAFRTFRVGHDRNLTARMESLIRPGAAWSDQDSQDAEYAVLLHPELVFSPGRTLNIIGRAVVSPLDSSALVIAGFSWNIFTGFYAESFAAAQLGDNTAVFGWDRPGSLSMSSGFRYRF
ncbi:MAG: hypothetical protein EA428_10150 [Spirochaetaceae bacterium]|nr:MAG: hypothetical protein EA428_10150 [Spirochaetaceae bacterium]